MAGRADVIVSGDGHLRHLKSYQGIPIVRPVDFQRALALKDDIPKGIHAGGSSPALHKQAYRPSRKRGQRPSVVLAAALTAPEGAGPEEGRETGLLGKEGRSPDLGKEFMRDAENS
jgi:hypothetical protein